MGRSASQLGQVGCEVVGEPAIAGPEGLGPDGLGVPHDPEPVFNGVEGDYLVVPDPEPLPAPGEVDVLGREAQRPGAGVDRLLPLYGPAAEGAGPVVEDPGDPDAQTVGGAAAMFSRARRSRKARRRSSSSRVMMPSLIAWATPCRKAFLQGAFDVLAGGAGAVGDGPEGLPEGGLVESVGTGGLSHQGYHLLPAGPVGLPAFRVVTFEDAGLLAAVAALASYGLEELGEGHLFSYLPREAIRFCPTGQPTTVLGTSELKPRWNLHLWGDEYGLRRRSKALPAVPRRAVQRSRLTSSICVFHLGFR